MSEILLLARSGHCRHVLQQLVMLTSVSLRLILETEKEQVARAVLARVKRIIDFEVRSLAPYSKGGFEANVSATCSGNDWPDVVERVIAMAQSLAHGWRIYGSIADEVDMVASEGFRVEGVQFVWIVCVRPNDG